MHENLKDSQIEIGKAESSHNSSPPLASIKKVYAEGQKGGRAASHPPPQD